MAKMTPVQQSLFLLNRAIMVFDSKEDLIANSKKIEFSLNDVVLIKNKSGVEYKKLENVNHNGIPYAIDETEPSKVYYWNSYKINTGFIVNTEAELSELQNKAKGEVVFCLGKDKPGDGKHTLRVKASLEEGTGSIPAYDEGFWNVVPNSSGGSNGGGGGTGGEEVSLDFLNRSETLSIINKYKDLGKKV